ncbi:MAG: hypothetical protein M1821_004679 [Bathelium mastoideum]|nr:MAG: hypothetical protein M1821_004679 [Bathelium mastoideum]
MGALARDFDPSFWSQDVIQLARHSSSVQHALLALSSTYEHFSTGKDPYLDRRGFAFYHYGEAMKQVAGLDLSQDHNYNLVLVTSLLFMILEVLQGHYHAATCHVKSGMKILAEQQSGRRSQKISTVCREVLTRFFLVMETQIRLMSEPEAGSLLPKLSGYETAIPDHFLSFDDALVSLEILSKDLFRFGDAYHCLISDPNTPMEVFGESLREYQRLKDRIKTWEIAVDQLLKYPMKDASMEQRSTIMVLSVYRICLRAFFEKIGQGDDSCYKKHLPRLWAALWIIEEFIQEQSTSASTKNRKARPTFSLSTGIVPVLCELSLIDCDIAIREKALSLLRTCNRREGLWDSRVAVQVAEGLNLIKATPNVVPVSLRVDFTAGRQGRMTYKVYGGEPERYEERVYAMEWDS